MKERISATIEDKTRKMLKQLLKNNKYRNMSHVIEKAVELLWGEENDKNRK
ncbi:MAG: hypothetical protein AABX83_01230 [Nanoarchaeota archaeon]